MPLLCCDVGLVSELRLTAGCVLMDLVSPAVSGTSVHANGLNQILSHGSPVPLIQFQNATQLRFLTLPGVKKK